MPNRERVARAIEGPVEEAAKLLAELTDTDAHTRLTIAIDGWGRGLAAGLEELAVAVDELHRSIGEGVAAGESTGSFDRHVEPAWDHASSAHDGPDAEDGSEAPDEQELRERTAAVGDQIASIRQETEVTGTGERGDERP
jgi:hypothetical protein